MQFCSDDLYVTNWLSAHIHYPNTATVPYNIGEGCRDQSVKEEEEQMV